MLAAALIPLILAEMVATGGIKMRCDPRAVEFNYQVLRKWLQWQSVLTQDAGLSNLLEHGITFPSSLFLSQVTCIVSHLVGGVWIEGKVRFLDNPRRQSSLTTQDSGNRSLEIKEYTPVGWVRGEGHTPPRFSQEIWKALSKIEGCVCVCAWRSQWWEMHGRGKMRSWKTDPSTSLFQRVPVMMQAPAEIQQPRCPLPIGHYSILREVSVKDGKCWELTIAS